MGSFKFNSREILAWVNLWLSTGEAVVQLGGPDPSYNRVGATKVGASKSFLLTDSSSVVKIKTTRLSLLSHSLGP